MITVLLLGLTGAVFGYFLGNYLFEVQGNIELPPFYYLIMIFLLLLAFIISIAVHEAGHLFAGNLLKFQFYMLVVGPFLWALEDGRLIFKWNKNLNIFGGLTYSIPENEVNLRRKFLGYVAGGPLASLLFAGIMYWLMHVLSPMQITDLKELFVQDFFKFHAFISMMIFLAAIIPVRSGGFKSDGGRMITLLKNNAQTKIELFLITTHTYLGTGTRPSELRISEIEQYLIHNSDDHYTINCHYYLHLVHFDRQEYHLAHEHLQKMTDNIDSYPTAMHSSIWLQVIFLQPFYGEDIQLVEELWKGIKYSAITAKTDYAKAEAATLLLKGENDAARNKIAEARQHLGKVQEKGMRIALEDWLDRLAGKLSASNELNSQTPIN